MATKTGVYDSGIGGLTTLALLQCAFPEGEFLYLADNARMPFGSKSRDEVCEAAKSATDYLKKNADIVVFGCNTASVTANPEGVFKLAPSLDGNDPKHTLLMATPRTLAGLDAKARGFICADTPELAVLVEVQASLAFKRKNRLRTDALRDYLMKRIGIYSDEAKKVLVGCSHYAYAEKVIKSLLGDAECDDGNAALVARVMTEHGKTSLPECFASVPHTEFVFTGANEEAKYRWLLARLHAGYAHEKLSAIRESLQR